MVNKNKVLDNKDMKENKADKNSAFGIAELVVSVMAVALVISSTLLIHFYFN